MSRFKAGKPENPNMPKFNSAYASVLNDGHYPLGCEGATLMTSRREAAALRAIQAPMDEPTSTCCPPWSDAWSIIATVSSYLRPPRSKPRVSCLLPRPLCSGACARMQLQLGTSCVH